jgi:hypothetical protein
VPSDHRLDQSATFAGETVATRERFLTRLVAVVEREAAREGRWIDRVRAGLVALLGFLDDEPRWASALFCGSAFDREATLRCEMCLLGLLATLLDDGAPRPIGELVPDPQLLGEFVAGSLFAVIRARLNEAQAGDDGQLLVELAPSLMAFIVTPYLGQAAASAELSGMSEPSVVASSELDKRLSVATPLAYRPATSAPIRGRRSRLGAFSHTGGVGGSPGGGLARRSIVNREDKGVVDK